MEIIYRANDRKEFDNELDCINHELQLEVHKLEKVGGIVALNYYNEKIPNYLEFFETITHIYFENEQSIDALDNLINNFRNSGLNITMTDKELAELFYDGLPEPKKWYHWNDCEEYYECDEDKIKELQDHIEEYDDILKKVREENGN